MKPLKTIQKHDINENLDFFSFLTPSIPYGIRSISVESSGPLAPSGILCTLWNLWRPLAPWLVESGKKITTIRLGDRGPEIDQVQHYSNITQGQEERIPKT